MVDRHLSFAILAGACAEARAMLLLFHLLLVLMPVDFTVVEDSRLVRLLVNHRLAVLGGMRYLRVLRRIHF